MLAGCPDVFARRKRSEVYLRYLRPRGAGQGRLHELWCFTLIQDRQVQPSKHCTCCLCNFDSRSRSRVALGSNQNRPGIAILNSILNSIHTTTSVELQRSLISQVSFQRRPEAKNRNRHRNVLKYQTAMGDSKEVREVALPDLENGVTSTGDTAAEPKVQPNSSDSLLVCHGTDQVTDSRQTPFYSLLLPVLG